MQQHKENKNTKSSPHILLLAFAVVIVAGTAYHFWPKLKSFRQTVKADVVVQKNVSLTGIFYTEDSSIAIVDGQIVRENDLLDGIKVLKILRDKVEFEKSGRSWTQSMPAAEQGISSALPVLLELGSPKCPPCRKMMPILNRLKADYSGKFRIRHIDVWQNKAAGTEYGVKKIPTQIFYDKNGTELHRHIGFYSKKEILAAWKSLGYKF